VEVVSRHLLLQRGISPPFAVFDALSFYAPPSILADLRVPVIVTVQIARRDYADRPS
jgi:hypothetical protein